MAMDVYDHLAVAVQAAYAEKEASEEARLKKIRLAFDRSGVPMEHFAGVVSQIPTPGDRPKT